jgi:hypothetical protein
MASALDGVRSIQRIEQHANRSARPSTALDALETRGAGRLCQPLKPAADVMEPVDIPKGASCDRHRRSRKIFADCSPSKLRSNPRAPAPPTPPGLILLGLLGRV